MRDLKKALLEGLWFINEHNLALIRYPGFKLSEAVFSKIITWIRLPELPLEYFDKEILFQIGIKIGKAVKIDVVTEGLSRGRFARIFVEIDLMKPLIPAIRIANVVQTIMYE